MLGRSSIKLVVAGPSGVGKTAFGQRFTTGQFKVPRSSTVGIGFVSRSIIHDGVSKILNLWDCTITHFSFRNSLALLFEDVDGVLLLVDAADESCREHLTEWLKYVKDHAPGAPCLVVYHKCDRLKGSFSDACSAILHERRIPYIYCSSLLNIGVDGAVALLLAMLMHDPVRCSLEILAWPRKASFMALWWRTLAEIVSQEQCVSPGELQMICCAQVYGLINDVEQLVSLDLPGNCNYMLQQMFIQWPPERHVSKLCLLTGGRKGAVISDADSPSSASASTTTAHFQGRTLKSVVEVEKSEQKSLTKSLTEKECSGLAGPPQRYRKLLRRLSSLTK